MHGAGSFSSSHSNMLQGACTDVPFSSHGGGTSDHHQKQFLKIKRRNQIQNAMAHPSGGSPQDRLAASEILDKMTQ